MIGITNNENEKIRRYETANNGNEMVGRGTRNNSEK